MTAAAVARKAPGVPPAIREILAMQRESYLHHEPRMLDFLGGWWGGLTIEDRRLLLAFCGLDDSAEAARRPWVQLLQEHRDRLLHECKRLARLLTLLRFAG